MSSYLDCIQRLAAEFESVVIEQRPRQENRHADALAYLSAAVNIESPRLVVVDFQESPSTHDNQFTLAITHASGGEHTNSSRNSNDDQQDTEMVDIEGSQRKGTPKR
ncbi:hypothetical protein BVC80_93g11 [Macleaya cordata]|uniref:Uncharacterized protein n=1 Tax=Macleaya cordata TaxID=56857 RepID=A0A200Q6N5_MACCD|nr:hypothetical protein BVC80_93g11 [Macleaya cordata]